MKTGKGKLTLDNTGKKLKDVSGDFGFINEYANHSWSLVEKEKLSLQEEERINETISLIPKDCSSILDAGCGDGRIINRLISEYGRVVGLDQSQEALRHVKAEKILGSIESLSFPDKSFDLVLCCEVLEHLPFEIYPRVLTELERVARKYIIVTVPNNEDIRRALIVCPHCGCAFHSSRHLRSFNRQNMKGIFSNLSLKTLKSCGLTKEYPGFFIKIAKFLRIIRSNFPLTGLCPQCGYTPLSASETSPDLSSDSRNSHLSQRLRRWARWLLPTKKTGGWLMALYQREQKRP